MPPKKKVVHSPVKKPPIATKTVRKKIVDTAKANPKSGKQPKNVDSKPTFSVKNTKNTKLRESNAGKPRANKSISSSSSSSSLSSSKASKQSKTTKPKPVLLPTRPPSARRREKLERQLALLHGVQLGTPDDTDETDDNSNNSGGVCDEENTEFAEGDSNVEEAMVEEDTSEVHEVPAGLDEEPTEIDADMSTDVVEEVVTDGTVEVEMEIAEVKDVDTETCEIARQLAALEVDQEPINENVEEKVSDGAEGAIFHGTEIPKAIVKESVKYTDSYEEFAANLRQVENNQQVVIEEVVVDSVEGSFEIDESNACEDMRNVEEIIGFTHKDLRLASKIANYSEMKLESDRLPNRHSTEVKDDDEVEGKSSDNYESSNDEKAMKTKKKITKESKQKGVKVIKKDTKAKPVKKVKKNTNQDKKLQQIEDENSIRRSNRIKTISDQKKNSKNSDVNNLSTTESDKTVVSESPKPKTEPEPKPPRSKTRWQKIPEPDMNLPLAVTQNITSQLQAQATPVPLDKKLEEEVGMRLKQFVHLKENAYKTDRMTCKEAKKMICDCILTDDELKKGEKGCGEDCLNRLLLIECGNLCPVNDRCTNKRFQKGQFAPVEVFKTEKKGLGLRAAANIPYGEFILEYVGEVLNPGEFDRRAEHYSKDKNLHYYFMSLRADAVIDATIKGNISRFINHSCDPNAETQKWTVNGELRIGFFSTRTILAGEEITFDYRFQRYGKEAQKCYCEAPTCRGWLGEEPEEEEDEDEEEEEEEIEEEEEEVEEEIETVIMEEVTKEEDIVVPEKSIDVSATEEHLVSVESSEVPSSGVKEIVKEVSETLTPLPEVAIIPTAAATVTKVVMKKEKEKKVKVTKTKKKKPRTDLFEEFDQLDNEIDLLVTTGLKNQAHTLKLSRLIVRAKEPALRTKLLRILRRGELPCRRLFLDYHGLRLIHGYMIDAQQWAKKDKKFDSLRLELLQTLATLPIPNMTMLQDSKVLSTVEKWSHPEKGDISPPDSDSNSPSVQDPTPELEIPLPKTEPLPIKEEEKPIITEQTMDANATDELDIRKSVGMVVSHMQVKGSPFQGMSGKDLADEISKSFDEEGPCEDVKVDLQLPNYEEEIVALGLKLLEEWANLKESFRIPKKERIEQMKLHEREANKGFYAGLGSENDERRSDRYRQRYRLNDSPLARKGLKPELTQQLPMNKHERRKIFALQVEFQEEERRRKQQELWRQHEKQCMMLGTDPRFTAPFDLTRGYQCIWNPQVGQWQNYPIPAQNQTLLYSTVSTMPNTSIPPPQIAVSQALPQVPTNIPPPQIQTSIVPQNNVNIHSQLPPGNIHPPLPTSIPPPQISTSVHGYQYAAHPMQNMYSLHGYSQMHVPNVQQLSMQGLQQMGVQQMPQMQIQQPLQVPMHNPPPHIQPPLPPLPATPKLPEKPKEEEEKDDITTVRFAGPIPPPVKLPPKWKCGKDKYGRPYYYHVKIRQSQWEPPPFPEPEEEDVEESSESSSSLESSSGSSDSSSDDSDSDEEMDDTKLLLEVRKQMEAQAKLSFKNAPLQEENESPSPVIEEAKQNVEDNETEEAVSRFRTEECESSIDRRLKEQFNLLTDDEPPSKKQRTGLVQEIIISPRTEEVKLQYREDLKQYKRNKEELKRQKEQLIHQVKKQAKEKVAREKILKDKRSKAVIKSKLREMTHDNSEKAKKIKETFRVSMANVVVGMLNSYRKPDCREGRITTTDDFKHLARKLTHFVMLKEMKHITKIEELVCTDNVKSKAREYIKKYMAKYGETYQKRDDEPDFKFE